MMGKILAGVIVITALIVGSAMYYFQEYGFYEPIPASVQGGDVRMTTLFGEAEIVPSEGFEGIDANSSPIRYRACFTLPMSTAMMTETYETYLNPEPNVAPGWFECFDAKAIGKALEEGEATAFLGEENIHYGIDRVIAVFEDGRAYAWHQINACGETVFDGNPAPEGCPPAPEVGADAPQAPERTE
ncbi:MAG: DUF6446 family protein [Paracoccaceae bacterium]